MIQTIIARPAWPLTEDVKFMAIREFNSFEETTIKPVPAKHEVHMMFMIGCQMEDFQNNPKSGRIHTLRRPRKVDCSFSGILTQMPGSIVFKGPIKLLVIHFTPTGFYRLFGISPKSVTDIIGEAEDAFSRDVIRLHEQLHEADTYTDIFRFTEQFLFDRKKLQLSRFDCPSISQASEFLLQHPNIYSIAELAHHSNMTIKTFERKFIEHVGVAPKLFKRILRFNQVLENKTANEKISWTELCHRAGYYDQAHLVKEFYAFTGASPSDFFNQTPPPVEAVRSNSE